MVFIIICLMAILIVAMACFLVIGIAVFCIGAKTLSNKGADNRGADFTLPTKRSTRFL